MQRDEQLAAAGECGDGNLLVMRGQATHARNLGSRASRNPSPSRLKPSTVTKMATPGVVDRKLASRKNCMPKFSIEPHDASGGWMPSPRNESAASARMAFPMPSDASTINGPTAFGSKWRTLLRATRRLEPAFERHPIRVVRRHEWREDRGKQQHQDDDQTGHCRAVASQPRDSAAGIATRGLSHSARAG